MTDPVKALGLELDRELAQLDGARRVLAYLKALARLDCERAVFTFTVYGPGSESPAAVVLCERLSEELTQVCETAFYRLGGGRE